MNDRELIRKKFSDLKLYLKELEKIAEISRKELKSSLGLKWQICHGLQLSIQIIIDVGNHILASIGENQIEDYTDIIDKLGKRNIIPAEFSTEIRGMTGLRNILVHEYTDPDFDKIYYILQNRMSDFHTFMKYINKFLDKS